MPETTPVADAPVEALGLRPFKNRAERVKARQTRQLQRAASKLLADPSTSADTREVAQAILENRGNVMADVLERLEESRPDLADAAADDPMVPRQRDWAGFFKALGEFIVTIVNALLPILKALGAGV